MSEPPEVASAEPPDTAQPQPQPQPQFQQQFQPQSQDEPHIFEPAPWSSDEPVPAPRPRRRPLFVLLGLIALVGAAFTGRQAAQQYLTSHTAKSVVLRYFEALESGDAPSALALTSPVPNGAYLTSEVLHQQLKVAALTDVTVSTIDQSSTAATVSVRYRLHFRRGTADVRDEAALSKVGGQWRIINGAGAVRVEAVGPGVDRVTLAGRPLGDMSVALFPGALPLATDSPLVIFDGDPYVTLKRSSLALRVEPRLSDAGRRAMAAAVDKALAACLTAARPDPNCPLPNTGRIVPGTLHGKASSTFADGGASVDLASNGKGLVSFGAITEVTGTWKAWDFNNQVVSGSGKIGLPVQARASIDDLTRIIWVRP